MKVIKISNKLAKEFESCRLLAQAEEHKNINNKQLVKFLVDYYQNTPTDEVVNEMRGLND